jgi:hypothetical protein
VGPREAVAAIKGHDDGVGVKVDDLMGDWDDCGDWQSRSQQAWLHQRQSNATQKNPALLCWQVAQGWKDEKVNLLSSCAMVKTGIGQRAPNCVA